jgi:hypothetical protein
MDMLIKGFYYGFQTVLRLLGIPKRKLCGLIPFQSILRI